MTEGDIKYRLIQNSEVYEFASKTELLDFISWQVTGYTTLDLRIENVKKANRQFRQAGGNTGNLRVPPNNR